MSIQAKKDIAPFNEVASLKNFSHNKINSKADPLLNKADLRSKFALENAGVGIWEWDISTDELIWSSVMFTLYGYDSHQENISSGSVLLSSIDPLAYNDKTTYNDFSAGMVFNNESFWFGLSMKHINRPNISFVKNPDAKLERFFSFNTGYEIRLSDHFDLFNLPYETSLLIASNYMQQGDFNRLDLGASLLFERLILGATVVSNPNKINSKSHLVTSLNFLMGLQYEKFRFAFSYDANVSRIGQTKGIFEFSLTYQFDLNIKCFGCPNYGRLMH